MSTLVQEIPRNRNDPGKFFGDGVTFKAKLIGILEVGEARGDRMCQEALQDLKMAIRAAGEHKQRITIHVTIDGLRLRDEKTGDSLYHHPVHKISFIAQDMTDSRAFGYIFGSPDSGHRFFGIKTDKAASQVVLAMRDLFQVVFELKKKEIELARQHLQSKSIHEHAPVTFTVKNSNLESSCVSYNKTSIIDIGAAKQNKPSSPESVADLVDLEQELSSIQRGITQMERITPSEPTVKSTTDSEDPFGDSFTNFPSYNLLPPPESSKSRHSKPLKPPDENQTESSATVNQPSAPLKPNDDWLHNTNSVPVFSDDTSTNVNSSNETDDNFQSITSNGSFNINSTTSSSTAKYVDAFTDLDPLGTGKNKPYVDKKYFFHDLKNPPKKVLKDLSGNEGSFAANFTSSSLLNQEDESNEKLCDIDLQLFENPTSVGGNKSSIEKIVQEGSEGQTATTSFYNNNINNNESNTKTENQTKPTGTIDPFMDEEDFSKISIDPFEFSFNKNLSNLLPDQKLTTENETIKLSKDGKANVFNGPLQVNLPPESWATQINQKKLERQSSETNAHTPTTIPSTTRNRPSVFKQNTVDVITSISSKKMKPHIFSQKFSKRDSNSINMRRLQESDSLSENETAPEPPPRPETGSHIEPPPLPPKKQFSDIVIRPSPRLSSNNQNSRDTSIRYDFLSSTTRSSTNKNANDFAPPLPLPSRKVGKTDSSYPGPGRPKKPNEEEDYLTPISLKSGLPILLPPPQQRIGSKTRQNRRNDSVETVRPESSFDSKLNEVSETSIPDITLSQLLTLGIDDLAKKLNVPTTKLNTMTLVELTTYLSDFIENAKPKVVPKEEPVVPSPVFKVSFDQTNDSTFEAKFDDNFGETNSFVANFDHFNSNQSEASDVSIESNNNTNNSTDRYAVFREIIEQEINSESEIFETPLSSLTMPEEIENAEKDIISSTSDISEKVENEKPESPSSHMFVPTTKIDTKITEVISHAKDRYAALRDIILVEDLFEKIATPTVSLPIQLTSDDLFNKENVTIDLDPNNKTSTDSSNSTGNSPEINICPDPDQPYNHKNELERIQIRSPANQSAIAKDDLEIDEYMQRAISNLSLDSRDHLSPVVTGKSPISQSQNASTSPIKINLINKSPTIKELSENVYKTTLNDMSTSPIPIQKSPASKSPETRSPIPQPLSVSKIISEDLELNDSSRISDGISGSSPDDVNLEKNLQKDCSNNESWAVFDKMSMDKIEVRSSVGKLKSPNKEIKDEGESPCSSDGKDEWKSAQDYSRRWPNGQTSSSSRDVSPWDEEGPEYRRRYHPPDKLGHHVRHARRMNSCDEEYEFDEKSARRRDRRGKGPVTRGRENFDSENWYHLNERSNWSPPEDDDPERGRPFDRSSYERSTYGSPYEKRDHKIIPYDRRDFKNYDKQRKYHRDYARPEFEHDPYRDNGEPVTPKDRHGNYYEEEYERRGRVRNDYPDEMFDGSFDRESRDSRTSHKSGREYFYDRDKRSFDRESVESYESGRARRSFGSGEIYGSLDSRGEFRDRERHLTADKSRSWKKGMRPTRQDDDYEQDSEGDVTRRTLGDTRSLQRPVGVQRPRNSSVSSPWDTEDLTPTSTNSKSWKRPASASESERRLAENKRILCNTLSGSDGEKDRRFRKKTRPRNEKEPEVRPNYASLRYPSRRRAEDYFEFEEPPSSIQIPPPRAELYFPPEEEKPIARIGEITERQYYTKREHCFKNITPRSETRSMSETLRTSGYDRRKHSPREGYSSSGGGKDAKKFATFDETIKSSISCGGSGNVKHVRMEFGFDEFEDTPRSNTSSKFNFDEEQGFESDFNSPIESGKDFRFSNDFSEKDTSPRTQTSQQQPTNYQFDEEFPLPSSSTSTVNSSKLRFDDKVTISKFDKTKQITTPTQMFEDDFSKAEFTFEDEDKWNELPSSTTTGTTPTNKNSKLGKQNFSKFYNIKKSESVNIFAKKVDDPFEDDDFFKTNSGNPSNNNNCNNNNKHDPLQWEKNFAKFDENI